MFDAYSMYTYPKYINVKIIENQGQRKVTPGLELEALRQYSHKLLPLS